MQFNGSFNVDDEEMKKETEALSKTKKWDKWTTGLGMILGANIALTFLGGGALPTIIGVGAGYFLIKLIVDRINASYEPIRRVKIMKATLVGILVILLIAIVIIKTIYFQGMA